MALSTDYTWTWSVTGLKTGLEVGLCERLFEEIVMTEEMQEAA